MFVGEGPGQTEDQQGRPFVGRAGDLLVKLLSTLGWRRKEVFITNIVKCRPPGNRDPEPDEIAACAPYLQRQLEVLDPAVVVTLGRFSMAHFRPGERITQIHGTAVVAPPATGARDALAYALYHPAAALRSTEVERQSYDDIAGLPRVLRDARARRDGTRPSTDGGQPGAAGPAASGDAPSADPADGEARRHDPDRSRRRRADPLRSGGLMPKRTPAPTPDPGDTPLRIIPLGGVGEIGKNMYVIEYGDDIVVIDCGLMFPDEEMFGIDLVIPDVTYLRERKANVKAFLITHAHEDHVGGLPYILPKFPGVPVYASTLARGLLGIKIKEHKLTSNPLLPLDPGDNIEIGPFTVDPVPRRPLHPGRDGHRPPDAGRARSSTPATSRSTTPRSTASCSTSP